MENFAPDYYVRIITDDGEINPTNVLSISTQKDINGDVGNFNIVLNYDQNFYNKNLKDTVIYNQQSVFFKVKPMDYVEVYLKRNTGKFGIYNKEGRFLKEFKENEPCNIVERISNPHLVLCGFVNSINNNFSIGENSTNNSITIEGSCLAKILNEHHLFFNFPYWEFFTKQATAGLSLIGNRPHEAIDTVLTKYCFEIFDDKNSIIIENSNVDNSKVKSIKKKKHEVKWLDKKTNRVATIIHNTAPSFRNIYWATNKSSGPESLKKDETLGFFDWGRMEYIDNPGKSPYTITAEQSVLAILKDISQSNTNEFFIDEIGNIVIRSQLDAWDYEHTFNNPYVSDFVELKEEDIRAWNFSISDNELKTIVLDTAGNEVLGNLSPIVAGTGVAPIDDATAKRFLNDKTQDPQFKDIIRRIRKAQGKHLDKYDLSTSEGIINFWSRYGLRPFQIIDIYANTTSKTFENAWTWFTKYANYWWKGSLTVKGDSKYKIGQKGFIKNFALDLSGNVRNFNFYINSISHDFSWGEDWTTTINFTRGEIEGTFLSEEIKVKEKK